MPRALVEVLRMCMLSLAPAHFLQGLQHVGCSSLQPTPHPVINTWGYEGATPAAFLLQLQLQLL